MVSAVELQGLRIKEATPVNEWRVGDYGTARIAEKGTEQFYSLQEGEIWNGRIAMIAITGFAAQEAASHVGVVSGAGSMFFNPPF